MLIGYARVSTLDQTLDLQRDALTAAGCEELYSDTVFGSVTERPGLTQALSHLRAGDTLVVWRLDRLGRSLAHLIDTIKGLEQSGIHFKSVQEQLDTATSGGEPVFPLFRAPPEFGGGLLLGGAKAGLAAARARGRVGGRPRKLTSQKIAHLRALAADKRHSVTEICETLGISRGTFYRHIK